MGSANLNISVVEKRMLSQTEAAHYSGLAVKHFKLLCPVQTLEIRPGLKAWDKRDLDIWIDDLKQDVELTTTDSILGKL